MGRVLMAAAAALALAWGANVGMRPPAPTPVRSAAAAVADTAVARGHAVYERYGCSTCHGADGRGGFANTNSETEGKVPPVNFVAEGFTRPELRKKILDGFPTVGRKDPNGPRPPYRMPGWRGAMSDAESTDLVEFLWSLYPKSETQKWR